MAARVGYVGDRYDCMIRTRNPPLPDKRYIFDDAEVFLHCVYDVITLAKDADVLLPGSLEQSACLPLEVSDSSVVCPCWDGSTEQRSEMINVGDEGSYLSYERFGQNTALFSSPSGVWNLGTRYYSVFADRYCQQSSPNAGLLTINNLRSDEYNACYNDMLAASKEYGQNKCHWYT